MQPSSQSPRERGAESSALAAIADNLTLAATSRNAEDNFTVRYRVTDRSFSEDFS
jgi:hypothetical protein